jgi:hypothetical protein
VFGSACPNKAVLITIFQTAFLPKSLKKWRARSDSNARPSDS